MIRCPVDAMICADWEGPCFALINRDCPEVHENLEKKTMISPDAVAYVDRILDEQVSVLYKNAPLAQDWARTAKVAEEAGEAIAELILLTGQNPRKGYDPEARERLIRELADTALTAVFAIQHFTKDSTLTGMALSEAQDKIVGRMRDVEGNVH